jgi:hypothetical protein
MVPGYLLETDRNMSPLLGQAPTLAHKHYSGVQVTDSKKATRSLHTV